VCISFRFEVVREVSADGLFECYKLRGSDWLWCCRVWALNATPTPTFGVGVGVEWSDGILRLERMLGYTNQNTRLQ